MRIGTNYALKRITQTAITLFMAVTITFIIIQNLPGGPLMYVKAQLAQSGTVSDPQELQRLAEIYVGVRPDKPLHIQYMDYMTSILFELDLGRSIWLDQPVENILARALPWTIFVTGTALLINFSFTIVIGAVMAYKQGSNLDLSLSVLFQGMASVPYFVAALLLLYAFGFRLGWFPTGGRIGPGIDSFGVDFVVSAIYYGALPILSLVLTALGNALLMRANSVSVLGEDFIHVARLRGLSESRISVFYVAHNAILPMYTFFLLLVGSVFGGSVILETIFSYNGVGFLMFKAIEVRDYPLMMGAFLLITVAVTVAVLIADLTYGLIDPRTNDNTSS